MNETRGACFGAQGIDIYGEGCLLMMTESCLVFRAMIKSHWQGLVTA